MLDITMLLLIAVLTLAMLGLALWSESVIQEGSERR
ncbi:signal peptide protein [Paenibacillus sambharensis]|uniref:Signal peptide protein n=1 Tax=Paenibacillus sambharensis TaxID=1803190 RepID=A0A2W1LDQ2_9BACL|nr:hypothetical protein [Paenibacillus sambharensis]PZD96779.1 signal peptide protein [Paenibacillus sambharensis]